MKRFVTSSVLVLVLPVWALGTANSTAAEGRYAMDLTDAPAVAPVSWQEEATNETVAEPDAVSQEQVASSISSCATVPRYWVRGEYLYWWTKGNDLPALATSSPAGTPQADAGVLGRPGTQVLYGNDAIDDEGRSGLRIAGGWWLDDSQCTALEVDYFSVFDDPNTGDFTAATTGAFGSGSPIIARPFYDSSLNASNSQLVSFPNLVDGQIDVTSSSELHSVAVSLRRNFRQGCRGRIDLIGGYRYFRFREGLEIREQLVSTNPGGLIQQGTTFDLYDRFEVENDFHGGDIGLLTELYHGAWTFEALAKVALGNIHRTVNVDGATARTTPPPGSTTATDPGGLLALPSNMGQQTANDFAALPEFGIHATYRWSDCLSFRFGYSLVMLTDVARTGEQIDSVVDSSQLPGGSPQAQNPGAPGAVRPASLVDNVTDFWVQGISLGVVLER